MLMLNSSTFFLWHGLFSCGRCGCGRYGTDPRYMPRGSWQMALSRLYNNVNHECITIKTNSNPYY